MTDRKGRFLSSRQRTLVAALFALALLAASAASALSVTVVVTSSADAVTGCSTTGTGSAAGGGCTLRDAITFSNANPPTSPAQNLVDFNISGSGVQTITLQSNLPDITAAVVIDGYSQPGASPNTLALGDDAVLLIFVDGGNLAGGAAFTVAGGTGSVLRGLVVNGAPPTGLGNPGGADAIHLFSCCNRVVGDFIGVDPAGSVGRVGGLVLGSSRNVIGGPASANRNVISNSNPNPAPPSIWVLGDNNTIEGNYVGTDAAGSTGLATVGTGIEVDGSFNVIGGLAGRGNLISNFDWGVYLHGALAPVGRGPGTGNLICGNFIGTDAAGTSPIPNFEHGVLIAGSGNIIGTPPGPPSLGFFPGNRIAFNQISGVVVWGGQPPLPGSIPPAERNVIRSNSVFSNGSIGIDLGAPSYVVDGDGVTVNDGCDGDSGGNGLQNFPELISATARKVDTVIEGTLNSAPNTTYDIQLFANQACDPSGFGEGEELVGEVFVTTDSSCNASFSASVPVADAPVGRFITATATDPSGNTSEFSACQPVEPLRVRTRTRFIVDGPIRVKPGVPVELSFRVEALRKGAVVPSGKVVVSDQAGHTCQAELSSSGEGACSLTFPAAGVYRARARYEGSAEFEPSTSPVIVVLVGMPGR